MAETIILALNGGSSSLKFGLFDASRDGILPLCAGAAERIGTDQGRSWIRGAKGEMLCEDRRALASAPEALYAAAQKLKNFPFPAPTAVGHRVVHGGPKLYEHQEVTPKVLEELEAAAPFAPLHVPASMNMIRQAQESFPGVPQFACFDTAFHRGLPEAAARFALPRMFWEAGVRRYGFHGLSCESVLHALGDVPPRIIIAHLGNGASITAIANGVSVDTTMGLTPTGGIVMGTRPGDLDPGVIVHILRTWGGGAEMLEELLDKKSGLLGISGISGDMRRLHEASADPAAQCAIEIFCRSAKKAIGGFIALLGGLDSLVFTGGIGEHDPAVRAQICGGLETFGIAPEPTTNQRNDQIISSPGSQVTVRVMPSEEEAQIARHVWRLLRQGNATPGAA